MKRCSKTTAIPQNLLHISQTLTNYLLVIMSHVPLVRLSLAQFCHLLFRLVCYIKTHKGSFSASSLLPA